MAKILIKLNGKPLQELDLVEGNEYLIGRAEDCAISLDTIRGISRHHAKISHNGNVWLVERLSRFGNLQFEGQESDCFELSDDVSFQIGPYHFQFKSEKLAPHPLVTHPSPAVEPQNHLKPQPVAPLNPPARLTQAPEEPLIETAKPLSELDGSDDTNELENTQKLESTAFTPSSFNPVVHITYLRSKRKAKTVNLDGKKWVFGRDKECDVVLKESQVSRRHFQLKRIDNKFYIKDLETGNGTKVNDRQLPTNKSFELHSGDVITIRNVKIEFELRQAGADRQLAIVTPQNMMEIPDHQGALPAVMRIDVPSANASELETTRRLPPKKALLIGVGVLLIVLAYLFSGDDKSTQKTEGASIDAAAGKKLTADQLQLVKDSFNLALNHYKSGKYQLCLEEIRKVHEAVPYYENSKEIQSLCEAGDVAERTAAERVAKAQEQERVQGEIAAIVEKCRQTLSATSTVGETKECLQPAMDLNPEDPAVSSLIAEAEGREERKRAEANRKGEVQKQIQACAAKYQKAQNLSKSGELRKAREVLSQLTSGGCPSQFAQLESARRDLAAVQKDLNEKVSAKIQSCQTAMDQSKFRLAYESCSAALQEDPQNSKADGLKKTALSNLRREMKAVYEDSVLEESLGNVEAAKEKWKKILEDDIASDEYYQKSKHKLQTYGIGI